MPCDWVNSVTVFDGAGSRVWLGLASEAQGSMLTLRSRQILFAVQAPARVRCVGTMGSPRVVG